MWSRIIFSDNDIHNITTAGGGFIVFFLRFGAHYRVHGLWTRLVNTSVILNTRARSQAVLVTRANPGVLQVGLW